MESEKQISERWVELVDAQVLTPDSIDEDSEVVYTVDEEKLRLHDPVLYQVYRDDLDSTLAQMVEKGLLDFYIDDDGQFQYVPSEKSEGWLQAYEEQDVD